MSMNRIIRGLSAVAALTVSAWWKSVLESQRNSFFASRRSTSIPIMSSGSQTFSWLSHQAKARKGGLPAWFASATLREYPGTCVPPTTATGS